MAFPDIHALNSWHLFLLLLHLRHSVHNANLPLFRNIRPSLPYFLISSGPSRRRYRYLSSYLGTFFTKVFMTTILWAILMFLYGYFSFFLKRLNTRLLEWKVIIPFVSIMVIYTLICRVGFGSSAPLEPTWSYKINTDLAFKYYGFFGFFP